MSAKDPLDPEGDPFYPPAVPTLVSCLHCGQEYDSYRIEWRIEQGADGRPRGFWCCPIAGCGGIGFGFDILPVDPNYRDERGGWVQFDEEEAEALEEDAWEPLAGQEPNGDQHWSDDEDDSIPF